MEKTRWKEDMRYLMEATKLVNEKNDRKILAAVLFVKPDYFVTGDKYFHTEMVKRKVRVKHTRDIRFPYRNGQSLPGHRIANGRRIQPHRRRTEALSSGRR
jgi:hypothetical protein